MQTKRVLKRAASVYRRLTLPHKRIGRVPSTLITTGREPTQSVWVADCYFIVNVLDLPFASPIAILYIANCVCKSMINERGITLPVVYSRPFASKAVF